MPGSFPWKYSRIFPACKFPISEDAKLSVNDLAALAPFADFIEHEEE